MVLETANPGPLTRTGIAPASPESSGAAAPRAALEALALLPRPTVDDVAEAIVAWAHQQAGTDEFVEARAAFYASHGKFFPDDPFYDARMGYFLDCFAFSRPLVATSQGQSGMTPYELLTAHVAAHPAALSEIATARLVGLGRRRHSIFVITRLDEQTLVAKDLITGDKVTANARPSESFRGFAKKGVFQGFVYHDGETFRLSPGLILHASRALPVIRKFLRMERRVAGAPLTPEAVEALMARLATVQLRHGRHRHVDAKTIYSGDLLPKK